jgi:hypothetical protein
LEISLLILNLAKVSINPFRHGSFVHLSFPVLSVGIGRFRVKTDSTLEQESSLLAVQKTAGPFVGSFR